MSESTQLFYSDLFKKPNVGTEEQRKDLLDKIHYLKKNNIGVADGSNEGCFRSTHKYGEELDWLRDEVANFVQGICKYYMEQDKSLEMHMTKQMQQINLSMWTNVNEPGSINELHTHKRETFACTYNVQTKGTGNLVFRNPANILSDCNVKSPFIRDFEVEPQDGDLLVWPAWVPHLVKRNESDKQRINIAINVSFLGVKE